MRNLAAIFLLAFGVQSISAQAPDEIWARHHEHRSTSRVVDVEVDASGNQYILGDFTGDSMIISGGLYHNIIRGGDGENIFLAKLTPSGRLLWSQTLVGFAPNRAAAAALALSNQSVYVLGHFAIELVMPDHANLKTPGGKYDVILSKFDTSGVMEWYSRDGSVFGDDFAGDVVADTQGRVYMTGTYGGLGLFGNASRTDTLVAVSQANIFLVCYGADSILQWSTSATGVMESNGQSLALSPNHAQLYLGARFRGTVTFHDQSQDTSLSAVGNWDAALLRYDTSGSLLWANHIDGPGNEGIHGIVVRGNTITITGHHRSAATLRAPNFNFSLNGAGLLDVFVARYQNNANILSAFSFGGSGNDEGRDIDIDPNGHMMVLASFSGETYLGFSDTVTSRFKRDVVLSNWTTGGQLRWKKHWASSADMDTAAFAMSRDSGFVVVGAFADSLLTPGGRSLKALASTDGFHSRFYACAGKLSVSVSPVDTSVCPGKQVTFAHSSSSGTADWYRNGKYVPGNHSMKLTVLAPVTAYAILYDDHGCPNVTDTAEALNYAVTTPVIQVQQDTLSVSATGTFQWLFQGQPIPGATGQAYVADTTGTYSVQLIDSNGCELTSAGVFVQVSSRTAPSFTAKAYPNPTTDLLHVEIDQPAVWIWYDLQGSRVGSGHLNGSGSFSPPGKGMWLLELRSGSGVWRQRILSVGS